MNIDDNEFFRQATLRICGNLDIEFAMQDCLKYLSNFMPADTLHLTLYDPGLGVLNTIAIATPEEAKRVNIVIPMNKTSVEFIKQAPPQTILKPLKNHPLVDAVISRTGLWKEHSGMVINLQVKGIDLGDLAIYAKGINKYAEEHLRLFSMLTEPFSIALSNSLRYDELNNLKDMMADDIKYLHSKLQKTEKGMIIGKDFGLKRVVEMLREVSPMDTPVLLQGETGVGKEVIANAIHRMSRRKNGPFIQVNCGAIPETLIDSELFGHEKGAFTGAINHKRGCFERADGGTIFLDEVGELPKQAQVRMLRVLQEKEIVRVGGSRQIKVNIRVIAATHQDLEEMVDNGRFRADLKYRLNVFPIKIPPLRDRKEDIQDLVNHFIEKKTKALHIPGPHKLVPGAINPLLEHSWPGNVRELENVVERALILSKGKPISFDEIFKTSTEDTFTPEKPEDESIANLDTVISEHIKRALNKTKGKIFGTGGAAELLGVHPSTLRHRIRKLNISHGKKS